MMNNQPPFTLHIFVADGDPDGLRLVDRPNWIGKAVTFPRALYIQARHRDEFQQSAPAFAPFEESGALSG